MVTRTLDTSSISEKYRAKAINVAKQSLLITNFRGSEQEHDLSEPANCEGFGRVRHFRRWTAPGWPPNPLPIDPVSKRLGLPQSEMLRAQAFQNAVCNWRCWYCFVPFSLLAGDPRHSAWLTASELTDLYLKQDDPPKVLDLTGGQPDLTPEWIVWMMDEFKARGLDTSTCLWSDDNLSTDYLWRYLSDVQIATMVSYTNYARVGCFKGFDEESFSFNTRAAPEYFSEQFILMMRLIAAGFDVYAYVTLTAADDRSVEDRMARFVDRLQGIHPNLPLRTVPLQIKVFTPVGSRMRTDHYGALRTQEAAIRAWQDELARRFTATELSRCIADVPLHV